MTKSSEVPISKYSSEQRSFKYSVCKNINIFYPGIKRDKIGCFVDGVYHTEEIVQQILGFSFAKFSINKKAKQEL